MGKGMGGGVAGAAGGAGGLGFLTGNNALTKSLGLSGEQGEYYSPQMQLQRQGLDMAVDRQKFANRDDVQNSMQAYGLGKMDLESALHQGKQGGGMGMDEMRNQLAIDPLTGSKLATEQVQSNPILGQLYGKGGALERYGAEEQELAKRGYSLQPEDYEAYGQAQGDITRRAGQMEKGLASSLAARGLGGAGSGVAGVAYSGAAGNKMEQLAKMQTDIAQKRMDMNLNRLNAVRNHYANMGQMGQSAIQDQYGRNLSGVQAKRGDLDRIIGAENQYNQGQLGLEQANLASMQNKQANKGKTLMQGLGSGLFGSAVNIGQVPGKFVSGAAGGAAGGGGIGA